MPIQLTIYAEDESPPYLLRSEALELRMGRHADCDIRLPYQGVSAHHVTLFSRDGAVYQVVDQGSTNGTLLDGSPLQAGEPRELRCGAELRILNLKIRFEQVRARRAEPPAPTEALLQAMLGEPGFKHDSDHAKRTGTQTSAANTDAIPEDAPTPSQDEESSTQEAKPPHDIAPPTPPKRVRGRGLRKSEWLIIAASILLICGVLYIFMLFLVG